MGHHIAGFGELNMGNEMGNSNVTGLQEEENRMEETGEKDLQEDGCADDVKEENHTVPAVDEKDFNGEYAGLATIEGIQTVPAVEDTELHEKDARLASGEGNQMVSAVEETNFDEKITGLASDEGHPIVPAADDKNFHTTITGLASGGEHQIVPAAEDTDFYEILERLPSDEENQTSPAIEDKNIQEKVSGLASEYDDLYGAGDPFIDHQTSDGTEQDDSKVQPPPGSPQIVTESKDRDTESRIQPASLSADNGNDETSIQSNLEDKLSETSEQQIGRQISSEREEGEATSSNSTNSAPNSPEHLKCVEPDFDVHELEKIHADQSAENHGEYMPRSEEILGLSQLNAELVHTLAKSVGSDSNPEIEKKREEMASREEVSHTIIYEEKDEIGDGDEVPSGLSRTSSGSGNKSGEGLPMEMNLIGNGDGESPGEMNLIRNNSLDIQQEPKGENGNEGLLMEMNLTPNGPLNFQPEAISLADSLNSFLEVADPEVKYLVLTEETKLIRLELENQDDMYDLCPNQLCKDGKEGELDTSCSSAMDKDLQVEEGKVLENAYKLHSCDSSPNSTSEELCILSEMDTLPTDLIVINCNQEGNEPTEKKMEEEIIEKTEYSYTVMGSHSPLELQQHGNGEFSIAQVSDLDASDLTMENSIFAVELENKKPKTTSRSVEQCGERVSTESSPETFAIQAEMRKSPSFHFELLAEGSREDSDQTPLLYHDKTVTGSLSRREYGHDLAQHQVMPGEEESLKLEKSESDKSRSPFLSFLKEEEEAHLVASQKNQDTVVVDAEKKAAEEVWDSTSPKRRTKRRSKSNLFSNCICCATAIS